LHTLRTTTTTFPLLGYCSPLIFHRNQPKRQIYHSSTQEFAHTLSKPVYDIATANTVLKDPVDDKMRLVKISKFAPLDSIVWLPVGCKQPNQRGPLSRRTEARARLKSPAPRSQCWHCRLCLQTGRRRGHLGVMKWLGQKMQSFRLENGSSHTALEGLPCNGLPIQRWLKILF